MLHTCTCIYSTCKRLITFLNSNQKGVILLNCDWRKWGTLSLLCFCHAHSLQTKVNHVRKRKKEMVQQNIDFSYHLFNSRTKWFSNLCITTRCKTKLQLGTPKSTFCMLFIYYVFSIWKIYHLRYVSTPYFSLLYHVFKTLPVNLIWNIKHDILICWKFKYELKSRIE